MSKSKFKLLMIWSVILGIFLGAILIRYDIYILPYLFGYTIAALVIIFIVIFLITLYIAYRNFKLQMKMLNMGKYEEVIKELLNKHKKASKSFLYKQQYLGNVANCYNRMGNFEESLNYLDKINNDIADKNSKALNYVLYAHNLYFLGMDIEKAEELVNKSRQLMDMPETILLDALIKLELGEEEKAANIIEEYYRLKSKKKYILGFYTQIVFDEYTKEVNENFMLGYYYFKLGSMGKANKYLSQAAKCDYKNYFSDKAKELL